MTSLFLNNWALVIKGWKYLEQIQYIFKREADRWIQNKDFPWWQTTDMKQWFYCFNMFMKETNEMFKMQTKETWICKNNIKCKVYIHEHAWDEVLYSEMNV